MNLFLLIFSSAPGLHWWAFLKSGRGKMTTINKELYVNDDWKGVRDGICHALHRYAKANNNYMKNYDKNIESSYLMYLDANNLYGWLLSQKLPVNGFKWKKVYLNLMKTS